ncbi:MAG: TIGR01212 family radical SAM protein [Muribaculaceae bacterium]|nr:TIGR01212 family radical SAM protein [Muribaculaceae bacterium]MDE5845595.1 TIGR01212 family radical SAM protein [Muribaculaceae bacterium]
MNPYYLDYSEYLERLFPGRKMQKLTVNARFTCPNRDGSKGRGGCIYCNNEAFNPSFADSSLPVEEQLEKGKQFFGYKYPDMHYLAYFQAYTNTYGRSVDELVNLYCQALSVDKVDGVIIGTRPDCVDAILLDKLAEINSGNSRIIVEYGAESAHDITLQLINRGHSWEDTVKAVKMTANKNIETGVHLILGLPGETRDMMLQTIDRLNELPVSTVKFHQMQVVEGTELARRYRANNANVTIFEIDDYIDLCAEIIGRLRKDIAIERFTSQSPSTMLIAPKWGIKNHVFVDRLKKRLGKSGK